MKFGIQCKVNGETTEKILSHALGSRMRTTMIGLLLSLASVVNGLAADEYHFTKQIPIGGEGGWDYLSVDPQARRLYVTHATRIVAVDLNDGRIAGEIADTPGVHGFAVAPPLGFSSNGKENKVSFVDLKTLATNFKVGTGENPDAILYEHGQAEVYAFNGRGQSATVIGVKSGKVVATIPLGGKPEFAVADEASGRVFCNIEDKSEIVAIDTKTHKISARWPLAPGEEPSGLAFDAAHHRLFAGCENKLLVMLDSETGKVLASAPIGAGVDACAFDAGTGNVFASCGDGTVTIAKETGDQLNVLQTLQTERGARTMALDPVTHHIYTATAKFDAEKKDERGRPRIIDGTFHLLEYGPE
jgi:DNA-binding beta-propeller fold protein YncE